MKCLLTSVLFLLTAGALADDLYIVDTHTHFKSKEQIKRQQARGEKPNPKNTLTQAVTPEDYRKLADRLNISATLVVEAIDQEDLDLNTWIFDHARDSDLICGYVARENLSDPDFAKRYASYQETGFLNGFRFRREELTGYLTDETARKHLSLLEKDGIVADLLITLDQHKDALQLATDYPDLKIVINHAYGARMKDGEISSEWLAAVAAAGQHPNIHMKISSILNFAGTSPNAGTSPTDLEHYLPILNHCFDAFGEDRVIFGTNWGVCTHWGSVDDVVRIVEEFLSGKGESVLRKGMRDNAMRVYGISAKKLRN